jgi:lipopolysaccharide/colanic/teichoic acid biosynthesis glycosyltransferase
MQTTLEQPRTQPEAKPATSPALPTLWGMDWVDLHARFWASRGIQIVRPGEQSKLVRHAELYLLLGKDALTLLRVAQVLDNASWLEPDLIIVRVQDRSQLPYTEVVRADDQGRFRGFERHYKQSQLRTGRIVFTPDRSLAAVWQEAASEAEAWKQLRSITRRNDRYAVKLPGKLFDASSQEDLARFGHELVTRWKRPDTTISRVRQHGENIWADKDAKVGLGPGIRGPLWIGAGRELSATDTAVGPAVMWDRGDARPPEDELDWTVVETLSGNATGASPSNTPVPEAKKRPFKRVFDICFALGALLLTFPVYPLVMLAILLEDGRPFFFAHRRETLGGREFGCLKFRSMRKDSEQIKAKLMSQNQADGPQFFIKDDPRLTRVGAFIREYQLDELPQLWNILRGDMSVVGPRPSPYKENQYCPPWREARLSVRPGLTGLWQISRTREEGNDFQEWIKYDIKYVEKQSFLMDLWIIWRTVALLIRRVTG